MSDGVSQGITSALKRRPPQECEVHMEIRASAESLRARDGSGFGIRVPCILRPAPNGALLWEEIARKNAVLGAVPMPDYAKLVKLHNARRKKGR